MKDSVGNINVLSMGKVVGDLSAISAPMPSHYLDCVVLMMLFLRVTFAILMLYEVVSPLLK